MHYAKNAEQCFPESSYFAGVFRQRFALTKCSESLLQIRISLKVSFATNNTLYHKNVKSFAVLVLKRNG